MDPTELPFALSNCLLKCEGADLFAEMSVGMIGRDIDIKDRVEYAKLLHEGTERLIMDYNFDVFTVRRSKSHDEMQKSCDDMLLKVDQLTKDDLLREVLKSLIKGYRAMCSNMNVFNHELWHGTKMDDPYLGEVMEKILLSYLATWITLELAREIDANVDTIVSDNLFTVEFAQIANRLSQFLNEPNKENVFYLMRDKAYYEGDDVTPEVREKFLACNCYSTETLKSGALERMSARRDIFIDEEYNSRILAEAQPPANVEADSPDEAEAEEAKPSDN